MRASACSLVVVVAAVVVLGLAGLFCPVAAYDDAKLRRAAEWLEDRQNPDGSWGALEAEQLVHTAETVRALRAAGYQRQAYYRGITWLEGHGVGSVDHVARRAAALAEHGDDISAALAHLATLQDAATPGRDGWGASSAYLAEPLDTALALRLLAGAGSTADLQAGIDFLKTSRLAGAAGGWPVGSAASTDPFVTATVVEALVKLQGYDPTVATAIGNGMSALAATVNSSSPTHLQALAAYAAYAAQDWTQMSQLYDRLAAAQGSDGSWGGRIYDTALALRALYAVAEVDEEWLAPHAVPDPRLRAVINATLGRAAMDSLTCNDLWWLSRLEASGLGISDLTGLECAYNLAYADLRNNTITSLAPIAGLGITDLRLDGNPLAGYAVPALTDWGLAIMALLLLGLGSRRWPGARTNVE
ncbi:MAG: hypothetical protein AB1634_16375 [Thermodesulfobacteriota bacterium]